MLELLSMLSTFVLSVVATLLSLTLSVLDLFWDLLIHLHTEMPRWEGLLVGIALAWLYVRRDKHPLLRVLSSPLKLVLDILDLAWDQSVDLVRDSWDVVKRWVGGATTWSLGLLKSGWSRVVSSLQSVKAKLLKK
jgi:hypothetical protein